METKQVARGFGLFIAVLAALYIFLVGLDIMGNAFKVLAGDSAGALFEFADNPIAGLMVGVLATVMLQSSSTTTSIIVSAVGAGVLEVSTAVPMVFGANIGTSVTNTIVSMGFIADRDNYRRGFAGATVHDMFNYLNVLLWLPLEAIVDVISGKGGPLQLIAQAITDSVDELDKDDKWEGPLKKITSPFTKAIIEANKDTSKDFSIGSPADGDICNILCNDELNCVYKFAQKRCYLPSSEELFGTTTDPATMEGTVCQDLAEAADDDEPKAAFKFCEIVNDVPTVVNATIQKAAAEHYDSSKTIKGGFLFEDWGLETGAGWIALFLSLFMLIAALITLVKLLSHIAQSQSDELLKKALHMNGYLAILFGAGFTIFVQSSSITTSTLTPLVAVGTLSLDGMLPLTLGANIGTTVTGLLAALVSGKIEALQIALVHVLFNVFGVLVFYPVPAIRKVPVAAASRLGELAATFRVFPPVYILIMFVVYPGFFLGLSVGFSAGTGGIVGSVLGLLAFLFLHAILYIWYNQRGGREFLVQNFGHDFDKAKQLDEPASTSDEDSELSIKVDN